jgi:hypothetical protein
MLLLDIMISFERGYPLVVRGAAHYGCYLLVEVVGHLMVLLTVKLDDFVLVDDAGYGLDVAGGGSSEELHESTLMRGTDHLMDRELSLHDLGACVPLDLLSQGQDRLSH